MEHLKDFVGKVRPQVFLALCLLGAMAVLGIITEPAMVEVSIGAMAGIIALAKDVLQSDA
jgi:hypothetical protein